MKRTLNLTSIIICAGMFVSAQNVSLDVSVHNPLAMPRTSVPVVIDLASQVPGMNVSSAKVTAGGREIASQLDDLDGDAVADELVFLADVKPSGSADYRVVLSSEGKQAEYPARTRAYIKLRDEKQVHPEINSIVFPGNADLLAMYNSIYGHGAVMETEPVALRIYMDNRQSVDIYSKTTPQLELDVTGFYTTRDQLAQGYGCDILWAGKSVGAGSFRGFQNDAPCYVDTVDSRGQRVIVDGPVRSIVEVADTRWIYNGHPIDMTQRYTMYAGHRDVDVDITVKGAVAGDSFCTGVQKLESDNTGFVLPSGLAGSWGSNVPDKGAPDLVEEVGLGVWADPANLSSVKEDEFNYLTLLAPDDQGRMHYNIIFCGAREKGGFTDSKSWFDHLFNWQKELKSPCRITVKRK